MKFTEKKIVVILFVMVLVSFSLAQEDSRKMEKMALTLNTSTFSRLLVNQAELKIEGIPPVLSPIRK